MTRYRVHDYSSGAILPGRPSAILIDASICGTDTGSVLAMYDAVDGVWREIRADERSLMARCGYDVRTVYVMEVAP